MRTDQISHFFTGQYTVMKTSGDMKVYEHDHNILGPGLVSESTILKRFYPIQNVVHVTYLLTPEDPVIPESLPNVLSGIELIDNSWIEQDDEDSVTIMFMMNHQRFGAGVWCYMIESNYEVKRFYPLHALRSVATIVNQKG